MIIPVGTDAPIYHWPFATGSLIVLNSFIFFFQVTLGESAYEPFMLHYGSLNPIQWVSNNFLHADIFHLIGNMIFLALFGLIVEGKVGWWKFLALYMICGTLSGLTIQLLAWNSVGMALGASDAIFAIMAIALFWAPENEVRFIGVFYYRPFHFQVSVMLCCGFYLVQNFLVSSLTGFPMSGATAHLIGAVFGAAAGYVMIVRNMVDCEGFDLLSVIQGRRGKKRSLTKSQQKEKRKAKVERSAARRQFFEDGKRKVGEYIDQGHYELADARFSMLQAKDRSLKMPADWRLKIIKGLNRNKSKTNKVIAMMETYIRDYEHLREPMILNLGRLLVVDRQQPRKAIRILKSMNTDVLDANQRELFNKIVSRAQQMIDDGVVELED